MNFSTQEIKGFYNASEVPQFNAWWKKNVIPQISDVGLCLLPFMSMRAIKDMYYGKWIEETTRNPFNQMVNRSQLEHFLAKNMIKEIMYANIEQCEHKLLFGHYQLAGSKMHQSYEPKLLPRELHFSEEMVQPELWDFVGFGHIHLPQALWGHDSEDTLWKVQHIGATDKFRFDEIKDHRRYIIYNRETKNATEVSLDPNIEENRPQVRPMFQEEIDIPLGTVDPNAFILSHLLEKYNEEELGSSNFKVIINIHAEDTSRLDKKSLRDQIEQRVFYLDFLNSNIIRTQRKEDFIHVEERTSIDLPQVLDDFLKGFEMKTNNKEDVSNLYERLVVTSHEILSEAIQRSERDD
jgi:hypothetical protein